MVSCEVGHCCFYLFCGILPLFLFLRTAVSLLHTSLLCVLQEIKIFSEDGSSKVVEILTDMTARDLCQLLVYRSHSVDDNSWTIVEYHPQLGLGRELPEAVNAAAAAARGTRCPRPLAGGFLAALMPPASSFY